VKRRDAAEPVFRCYANIPAAAPSAATASASSLPGSAMLPNLLVHLPDVLDHLERRGRYFAAPGQDGAIILEPHPLVLVDVPKETVPEWSAFSVIDMSPSESSSRLLTSRLNKPDTIWAAVSRG
jgi:hypothetical protein